MNMSRIFGVGTVALAVTLAGSSAPSLEAAQSRSDTSNVVTLFIKSDGARMDRVVSGLSRDWAKKKDSIKIVKREADADLVVTLGSRARGGSVSLTLTATFGPQSEPFGGDDFGYLIPPSAGGDFSFASKPDVKPDRLGGDDFGYLVDKADAWLTKNRARVLAVRR